MTDLTVAVPRMTSLGFDPTPFPAGCHMCFLFDDDAERQRVLAQYVQSGLDEGEQVAYFVDVVSPADLVTQLRGLGVAIPQAAAEHQLIVGRAEAVYCPDGSFDVERMLRTLETANVDSLAAGYRGLRVSGEMNWALRGLPGSERLLDYESRVNTLMARVPVTAICQYDTRLFDGETLYRLLTVHPMMIVRGRVVRNPYYTAVAAAPA